MSRFFIDRPIFAGVLSTLIFVAGLLSLPALPISEYPEVAPPTVVVRAQYPGANPKVIAETVSTPIEWDEVETALKKKDAARLSFVSDEALKRVEKLGDLFAPMLKLKQKLPQ